jgi:hypothetical protein
MTVGKLSRAEIVKLLEERRRSFHLRVEAQARSAFQQREIRQRMLQHLRDSEKHNIGMNVSPMGAHVEYLTRARREMLIASLLPRP